MGAEPESLCLEPYGINIAPFVLATSRWIRKIYHEQLKCQKSIKHKPRCWERGYLRRMSQNSASSVISEIYTGQVTKIQNAETQEHMTTKIVT